MSFAQRWYQAIRWSHHRPSGWSERLGVITSCWLLMMVQWGCDLGQGLDLSTVGPELTIVGAYPAPGEGLNCRTASDCAGVPINADIELRLSRYLDPASATRQSVRLYAAAAQGSVFLEPEYDLIENVVRFRLQKNSSLQPSTLYTFEAVLPSEENPNGLRAFDGAPLASGPLPLKFQFFTGAHRQERLPEPPPPSCDEVLTIFRGDSGCAHCHQPTQRSSCGADGSGGVACAADQANPLDLSSKAGLRISAIERVARQTQIGPHAEQPLEQPARVGVQMPLIDPYRPENSYLFYKLLRNPENFRSKDGSEESLYRAPKHGETLAPSPEEQARLREFFVRQAPMPPPGYRLELEEFRLIQRWIRAGAHCSSN